MRRFAALNVPKQKKINEATFWEYLERVRKNPQTMLKKIPPEHWKAMTEWFWKVFERLNSLTSHFDFGLSDSSLSVANRGVVQMGKEGYYKVMAALKEAKKRRDFDEPEKLTKLYNRLYDKTDPAFLYWFMNLEDFLDGDMTEEELATHFSIPKRMLSKAELRAASYSPEAFDKAHRLFDQFVEEVDDLEEFTALLEKEDSNLEIWLENPHGDPGMGPEGLHRKLLFMANLVKQLIDLGQDPSGEPTSYHDL